MNICVAFRQDYRLDGPVECYARSVVEALQERDYPVTTVGEGHIEYQSLAELDPDNFDLLIEIENGRNSRGKLFFQQTEHKWSIPSIVWLIDSHGHAPIHEEVSKDYNHAFFAVWNKRDIFTEHPSAHWCPNATDFKWFDGERYPYHPRYEFGFFGSKTGLSRAEPMIAICDKNDWTYDVRQVTRPRKHKWPMCAQAMNDCRFLFNHGQKHDGPNQRVMESMAMRRPLITDRDDFSGMDKLFTEDEHYTGYEAYTYKGLEEAMWAVRQDPATFEMADLAYYQVKQYHQVSNRVDQMLEVLN